MRILVFGASGIIGQHLRAVIPPGVDSTFARRTPSPGCISIDATDAREVHRLIADIKPDSVVNLAGESNTDYVETHAEECESINIELPNMLAGQARLFRYRFVQISSQAVFSGDDGPYRPGSKSGPVNEYGCQKAAADYLAFLQGGIIVRPTFVLGVRPDPAAGRANPIEQMLGGQRKQVSDRWFSVSFAPDVAACIWRAAMTYNSTRIIHAGVPVRVSRYDIARALGLDVEPVSHNDFPGLAPRPIDTAYAVGEHSMDYLDGLADCLLRWEAREAVAA